MANIKVFADDNDDDNQNNAKVTTITILLIQNSQAENGVSATAYKTGVFFICWKSCLKQCKHQLRTAITFTWKQIKL